MQQFKVGDYVRVPEYNKCFKFKGTFEDEDGTIYIADGYDEIFGQQGWLETECELWQPKEGEWCWFYRKGEDVPYLRRFTIGNIEDYPKCEPFIGELPSGVQSLVSHYIKEPA